MGNENIGSFEDTSAPSEGSEMSIRKTPVGVPNHVHSLFDSESGDVDSVLTEDTDVPKRKLEVIQVASLVINQMIGSGIFSVPALVLFLTKSKGLSLALWAVGGLYTFTNAFILLEYGTAFPFTGGPLIFLDEAFPRPRLLAAVIFSTYWIIFAQSGASPAFVQYAIILANPGTPATEIDQRLSIFLQMFVSGVICLALYFCRRFCLMLTVGTAAFKICLLLAVAIAGFVAARASDNGLRDFQTQEPGYSPIEAFSAMIYIIYTFEGWEYANYITGEIKAPKRTLKWAVLGSILLVTVLYMLVTAAFFVAMDFDTIQAPTNLFGLAATFGDKAFGSSRVIMGAVAVSSLTNGLTLTYAHARVKQAIAWQRFIPFWGFIGHQSRAFDSPGGALLLHWIVQALTTIVTPAASSDWNFSSGIFTYGYTLMMLILGLGLLRLNARMRMADTSWRPTYFKNRLLLHSVCWIFAAFNLLVLVVSARPHTPGSIPRFFWPVTLCGILVLALLYWSCLQLLNGSIGRMVGVQISFYDARRTNDNEDDVPDSLKAFLKVARQDGSNKRCTIKITSPLLLQVGQIMYKPYEWSKKNM